jgi:hypothetical protein
MVSLPYLIIFRWATNAWFLRTFRVICTTNAPPFSRLVAPFLKSLLAYPGWSSCAVVEFVTHAGIP